MNGYFGPHYFGRSFGKGPAPAGRRIVVNAGEISFAGSSSMRVDSKRRKRLQMRQLNVEEFAKLVAAAIARGDAAVSVPLDLAKAIATCAANGVRLHQGRSGAFKSQADEHARETAMKEAPQIKARYLAEARATGRRNPLSWAREKAAKDLQQRMRELGMATPPAVTTIMKRKF
jgi:hypothetical protein